MIRALKFSLILVFAAILSACGGGKGTGFSFTNSGSGSNSGGTSSSTGSTPTIQHVVVVVLENEDYSNVVGSQYMPYWNNLANQTSLATQFYADVHPSLGNYLIMTAGVDPTLGSRDPDNWSGTISSDNIASVLTAGGKTWKAYAQSLPSAGYTGGDQYPYVKHHNPFVYFESVLNDSTQTANIVNLSQFPADVSGGLPSYSFIIPDDEHNGHDCPNGGQLCALSDRLTAADNFLKDNIDPLLQNGSVMANTVVIITFDESATDATNGGGHIPVIVAGGPIKSGYQSTTTYQFQSLLRFSLSSLGPNNFPGLSSVAVDMNEFLK